MENLLSGYGRIRLIWPVCVVQVKIMLGFFLAPDTGTLLVPQAKDSHGRLKYVHGVSGANPLNYLIIFSGI